LKDIVLPGDLCIVLKAQLSKVKIDLTTKHDCDDATVKKIHAAGSFDEMKGLAVTNGCEIASVQHLLTLLKRNAENIQICFNKLFEGKAIPICANFNKALVDSKVDAKAAEACPILGDLRLARTPLEIEEKSENVSKYSSCNHAFELVLQEKAKRLTGWKAMDYAKLAVGGLATTAVITAAVRPDLVQKAKNWFRGDQKKIEPRQNKKIEPDENADSDKEVKPAKSAQSGMSWPVIAGIIIAVIAGLGLVAFFVMRGRS